MSSTRVVGQRCARREIVARPQIDLSIRIMETSVGGTPRHPLSAAIARQYEPGALVELRVRHNPVSQTASARHGKVMVGGRAVGVHLHARCSCDGQAQRRTALAVAMRVSDRGSGRSGAIGEAADMAIPDQPSVTVTSHILTQLATFFIIAAS